MQSDIVEDTGSYKIVLGGKEYVLDQYDTLEIGDVTHVMMGVYTSDIDVPPMSCIYIVDSEVKIKTVPRMVIDCQIPSAEDSEYDPYIDDPTPLLLDITDEDKELMRHAKHLLTIRGITTVGALKAKYGEERRNDMNNFKSRLHKHNTLSWEKFTDLLDVIGVPVTLVFDI